MDDAHLFSDTGKRLLREYRIENEYPSNQLALDQLLTDLTFAAAALELDFELARNTAAGVFRLIACNP